MIYNIAKLTAQEVAATQGAEAFREFDPKILELSDPTIFSTEKEVEGEIVTEKWCKIDSTIVQLVTDENGKFKSRDERITHHVFPFSVWQAAVYGVDLNTGKIKLKTAVLNQICATFGVKLI